MPKIAISVLAAGLLAIHAETTRRCYDMPQCPPHPAAEVLVVAAVLFGIIYAIVSALQFALQAIKNARK